MAVDVEFINNNSVVNINTNFERVKAAFDKVLGREGDLPNHMNGDLDLDGNDILNVKSLQVEDLTIDGENPLGILQRAEDAVLEAEQFSLQSEGWAGVSEYWAGVSEAATIPLNSISYDQLDSDLQSRVDSGGGGGGQSPDSLNFYSTLSLELSEDRANGPVFAGPNGNGIFDGFNTLDYVDWMNATNLDTSVPGELRISAPVVVLGNTPPEDSADYSAFTMGSTDWDLPNDSTVTKIGLYSSSATGVSFKIVRKNSPGNYTVVYSESYSHPGGGWADLTLSSAYTVPSSGDYYVAGKINSAVNVGTYAPIGIIRFHYTGDASGTATFVEDGGFRPTYRATVELADGNFEVRSDVITTDQDPEWVRLYAFVKPNSAIINTDLKFSVTRDDSSYTDITMNDSYIRHDGSTCFMSGEVDISLLPPGSSCRWRVTAPEYNAANVLAVGIMLGV